MRFRCLTLVAVGALGLVGCVTDDAPAGTSTSSHVGQGTLVSMDFATKGDFYAAPFPTDARAGGADVSDFPNPSANLLATSILGILASDAGGFGLTSGIFFRLSAPIDAAGLPSITGSVAAGSSVILLGIDPGAPDYLVHYPVTTSFLADGGPYGAPNLLAVLPLQGVPLRPKTRYAVVVTQALHDTAGHALGTPDAMAQLAAGARPAGLGDTGFASYQAALHALAAASIDVTQVAGLAAFTTGSPEDALGRVVSAMKASPPAPLAPFTSTGEVYDTFCVYQTTIDMPDYQGGTPPYTEAGGDWVFDASGNPVLQRMEEANFVVTIPRAPMPAAGYPMVVFIRTGAGGNRPLVDRGVQGDQRRPAVDARHGPGALLCRAPASPGREHRRAARRPAQPRRTATRTSSSSTSSTPRRCATTSASRPPSSRCTRTSSRRVTVDVSDCPGATAPRRGALRRRRPWR